MTGGAGTNAAAIVVEFNIVFKSYFQQALPCLYMLQ